MKTHIRVYYSHSKRTYDSEKEKNELEFLKKNYPNTICPNNNIGECSHGMDAYLNIVAWSEMVIFSEYLEYIGRGVYREIKKAMKNNIPVMVLRNNRLMKIKDVVIENEDDCVIRYAKVIV